MQTTTQASGIYPVLPNDDYHNDLAIGASGLKLLAKTPAHYWAHYLDPDRECIDKKAWRIGRAWHCQVFEPGSFEDRYAGNHDAHPAKKCAVLLRQVLDAADPVAEVARLVAMPEGLSATSKEGKALAAEIEGQGKQPVADDDLDFVLTWGPKLVGKDILPAADITRVQKMAAIARGLPISQVVFGKYAAIGHAEVSMFTVDPDTSARIKVRPDYMLQPCVDFPNGLIIDGKSTTDASDEGFARQVWNLDYGLQAALYTAVYRRVMGTAGRPAFLWLAQEKDAPYAARYYAAGADLIEYWDRRIPTLLRLFVDCQQRNEWPGYPTNVGTLEMPAWAQKSMGVA